MAKQLLGKEVTAALNEKIMGQVAELKEKGIVPKLGIVRVGENSSDISYEKGATKRCETLGVEVEKILLPEDISKEELLNLYLTKLKNLGIEVQKSKKTQLEGAQRCTLIEGYSVSDSIYFKEVVVFIDGKQYVYSYIADKDVYEKNVDNMTAYLMTLVVNDSQKAV